MKGELRTDELTELDLATLRMMGRDMTAQEIAEACDIEPDAVYNRFKLLRDKMGVKTNYGLMALAYPAGIFG